MLKTEGAVSLHDVKRHWSKLVRSKKKLSQKLNKTKETNPRNVVVFMDETQMPFEKKSKTICNPGFFLSRNVKQENTLQIKLRPVWKTIEQSARKLETAICLPDVNVTGVI